MFFSRLLCVAGAFSRNNYALGHHNSAEIQKWPGTVITFLDRVLGRSKSENDRQKCSNSPENETEYKQTAQENEPSERLRSLSARRITGINNETVTPQCTYKFMVPNADVNGDYTEYQFTDAQGNSVFSQTVTSGDELIVPQVTSTESAVFAGWYRGEIDNDGLHYDPEPYNFDNITITENSAITLYAVYTRYATVIFHDRYDSETDTFPVAYTQRVELTGDGGSESAQVKITDLDIENIRVGDSELGFLGWSETPVQTPGVYEDSEHHAYVIETDTDGCITVTGDKSLYPIFKQHFLLTFYAAPSGAGAAYNGPQYLFDVEGIDSLPTTSVDGYTFTGWWTGTKKENVSDPKPGEDVNWGRQITNADGTLITGADDPGAYVSDGKLYLRSDGRYGRRQENVYSGGLCHACGRVWCYRKTAVPSRQQQGIYRCVEAEDAAGLRAWQR